MHMKLKKINKRSGFKLIIFLFIIYVTFIYTFYYSFKSISGETNTAFIKFLINNNSEFRDNNFDFPKLINKSFNYILKIDLTKPNSFFNYSIIGYSDIDSTDKIDELKKVSFYITDPVKREVKNPIIYIYNTHQLENYNNSSLAKFGITPNVMMASYLLREKLNDLGIPSIVEDANITEFLSLNNWDYGSSYKASRMFMLDKQNSYSTLKYYIDIHRDSVNGEITTVSINGKRYAKILFVIGLEHDNYQKNLDLATKINELFQKKYPGISRGIYKKEGPNVNGIYNQDISPNVMLIEVGGIDNNIEEVMNTINAIADTLCEYIGEYDK